MGAKQPLLLNPGCPPSDDQGILAVLDLSADVLSTNWVELVLTPEGDNPCRTYVHGATDRTGSSRNLDVGDGITATFRFGGGS
ncbi:MAG: hypothetical protein MUP13_15195, partial [Thermoanaerobaculales bacterium]|nr:hypothetical protein [Thermoanaerobaculales bacterium]